MTEQSKTKTFIDHETATLNKRIETAAWALFLIMLGLNVARYFKGIK